MYLQFGERHCAPGSVMFLFSTSILIFNEEKNCLRAMLWLIYYDLSALALKQSIRKCIKERALHIKTVSYLLNTEVRSGEDKVHLNRVHLEGPLEMQFAVISQDGHTLWKTRDELCVCVCMHVCILHVHACVFGDGGCMPACQSIWLSWGIRNKIASSLSLKLGVFYKITSHTRMNRLDWQDYLFSFQWFEWATI